jgi:succinyl-diaminopimelate desuccinylase
LQSFQQDPWKEEVKKFNLDKINEAFEEIKDDALEFLKSLIRIPTENPPGVNYEKFVSFAEEKLRSFGYRTETKYVSNSELTKLAPLGTGPRPNLVASLGKDRPELAFDGHYDVVPAGSGWNVDPYGAVEEDGRLYGRGSCDMKAGIAAQIYAAELLKHAGYDIEKRGRIIQILVPDEETVGNVNAGTYFLVREGYISSNKTDYVIFTEPLGGDMICHGHRGAIWGFVKVFGRKAHGGHPGRGVDATRNTCKIVNRIYEEIPSKNMRSLYNITPEEGRRPTILIGTIHCGTWANTVADECEFSFVRRLIPEETVESARNELLNVLKNAKSSNPEFSYEYREHYAVESVITDTTADLANVFKRSVREVLRRDASFVLAPGTFDIRFTVAAGINSINYGPGRVEQAHINDEYVDVKDFFDSIKVLAVSTGMLLRLF